MQFFELLSQIGDSELIRKYAPDQWAAQLISYSPAFCSDGPPAPRPVDLFKYAPRRAGRDQGALGVRGGAWVRSGAMNTDIEEFPGWEVVCGRVAASPLTPPLLSSPKPLRPRLSNLSLEGALVAPGPEGRARNVTKTKQAPKKKKKKKSVCVYWSVRGESRQNLICQA